MRIQCNRFGREYDPGNGGDASQAEACANMGPGRLDAWPSSNPENRPSRMTLKPRLAGALADRSPNRGARAHRHAGANSPAPALPPRAKNVQSVADPGRTARARRQ